MPTPHPVELSSAVAALAVLVVVLVIHGWLARRAVGDLTRDDVEAASGSKRTWFIIIVLAAVVGPLAWFAFGRVERR